MKGPDFVGFAEEMRKQGIHVGLGAKPYCVTCDEPWPCRASLKESEKTDE